MLWERTDICKSTVPLTDFTTSGIVDDGLFRGTSMETSTEALHQVEKAFELYMTKTQPAGFDFGRVDASGRLDKVREAFYRQMAEDIILDSGTHQVWYDLVSDSKKSIYQLVRVWQLHPECEESVVTKREVVTQADSALSLYQRCSIWLGLGDSK
jgi:hypothetical protein